MPCRDYWISTAFRFFICKMRIRICTSEFWRFNEIIYIKSTLIAITDHFLSVRHCIKWFIFFSLTLWVRFHCQLHLTNQGTERLSYLLKVIKLVWVEPESETRQPDSKPMPLTITWYTSSSEQSSAWYSIHSLPLP